MFTAEFEWDESKNLENLWKHGISFNEAQRAFSDEKRVIALDLNHSYNELRYYCFGIIQSHVITVRFTWRKGRIRILGAGCWRKGRKIYEKANQEN